MESNLTLDAAELSLLEASPGGSPKAVGETLVRSRDRGALLAAVELATAEAHKLAADAIHGETFVLDVTVQTSNSSGGISASARVTVSAR